jgi:hypothetical protein
MTADHLTAPLARAAWGRPFEQRRVLRINRGRGADRAG